MNKTQVIKWLSETEIPLSKVSSNTGISRKTLYNWMNGSPIRNNNIIKLYNEYKHEIEHSEICLKGEKVEMDSSYVIDLQKDKIENQELQIKSLKKALQEKQVESTHWEALEYDFLCDVTLFRRGLKFGRTINSVTDLNKQSKVLGYTVDQIKSFWDIGVKHMKMSKHPISKIINEETQRDVKKQMSTLPLLFDAMKATVGDHYIPQPIVYIHKKGHSVGAIAYNKVEWKHMKVISKVQFLTE